MNLKRILGGLCIKDYDQELTQKQLTSICLNALEFGGLPRHRLRQIAAIAKRFSELPVHIDMRVDKLIVRGKIDQSAVDWIADDMAQRGQLRRVSVIGHKVQDGKHRVVAARKLGWTHISCYQYPSK